MAIAEELQIIVDAKVTQAVRDLKKVDKTIDGTTKTTKKLSESFKTLAGPVAIGAMLVGLGKISIKMINAASDGEETANKFNVVFASVADDAEEAADRIKDEFKLSDETVQNFLSGVGDITSGLGATSTEALDAAEKITSLGLDINSFANLSGGAEQAVKALTSLFTGEREAAKALGIVINDTNLKAYAEDMGKVFKELTPLEKGFLSLELATSQSQLAIGDFARSSDSYANTMKAAKEATKDLSASLGVLLLPAATASIGIFEELASKIADNVKEHNELRALLDKFENDNDTAADRVDLTEKQISATQKLLETNTELIKNVGEINNLREQSNLEDLYAEDSALRTQLRSHNELLEILKEEAAAEKAITDALAEKEKETLKLATLQLELSSTLEKRRIAALTDDEKAIDNLQKQIDYWAEFREIVGVQELLTDLVRERNELMTEGTGIVIEAADAFINLTFQANAYKNALMDAEFAHRKFTEGTIEGNEEAAVSWVDLANVAQTSMVMAVGQIAEELAKGELSFQSLAQVALGGLSKILEALGQELLAIAAVKTAASLFGPIGAGVALAGAAAAFLAAGLVKGGAASFATGGDFVTNGPQAIMVGDNPGGRERVTVTPESSPNINGPQGGGGGTYILSIDGEQFNAFMQQKIDNRQLLSGAGGAI